MRLALVVTISTRWWLAPLALLPSGRGLRAVGRPLRRSGVDAYHDRDFQDRKEPYRGWGKLKSERFTAAQEKILRNQTCFEIAVAVDRADHARIKKELVGVKGFVRDSDYGLALRVDHVQVCGFLAKQVPIPLCR